MEYTFLAINQVTFHNTSCLIRWKENWLTKLVYIPVRTHFQLAVSTPMLMCFVWSCQLQVFVSRQIPG